MCSEDAASGASALAVLRDRDAGEDTRLEALNAAVRSREPGAATLLSEILLEPTESTRFRRIVALNAPYLVSPDLFEPLLRLVSDDSNETSLRAAAAQALGELHDDRAVEPLLAILREPDDWYVLDTIAPEMERIERLLLDATEPLATQLQDLRAQVTAGRSLHDAVLEGLRGVAGEPIIAPLLPMLATRQDGWRTKIAAALGSAGPAAIEPLVASLRSPDPMIRQGAAEALGFAANDAGIEPLRQVLTSDEEPAVRAAAAHSLGYIGNPVILNDLAEALADRSFQVRLAAVQALFHLAMTGKGDPGILPQVERMAANDPGMTYAGYPVRYSAERLARELRRLRAEGPSSSC